MPSETRDRIEVQAMAGVVRALAIYNAELGRADVYPDTCPVANTHRRKAEEAHAKELAEWRQRRGLPDAVGMRPALTTLRCLGAMPDGSTRTCRYFYGLVQKNDETERVHVSIIEGTMRETARRQMECCVLCVGANRNRPPGI